jgi:hypothetical protein
MHRTVMAGFVALLALASGCTAEPTAGGAHSDTPCEDIIMACHEKDDGTGAVNDCHQVGHDEVASTCSAQLDMCLQICNDAPPLDDTEGDDHGEDDHGEDDHGETTASDGTSTGEPSTTDTGESTGDASSSSSSTGSDSAADVNCADLGSNCHDAPGKVAAMCHDVGHEGDEEACAEIWQECREACGF